MRTVPSLSLFLSLLFLIRENPVRGRIGGLPPFRDGRMEKRLSDGCTPLYPGKYKGRPGEEIPWISFKLATRGDSSSVSHLLRSNGFCCCPCLVGPRPIADINPTLDAKGQRGGSPRRDILAVAESSARKIARRASGSD